MDAWGHLPGVGGDAWERMSGASGDAWNRLAGDSGDAWERLIVPLLPFIYIWLTLQRRTNELALAQRSTDFTLQTRILAISGPPSTTFTLGSRSMSLTPQNRSVELTLPEA